jgi:uncharacterized damage-inducible protein DinB
MISAELAALFTRDLTRLLQEARAFPDTESIWTTAPGVANAAGTLLLHLEGNLREYIGRLVGGIDYTRDRPLEFSARGVERAELVTRIEAVHEMVPRVLAGLSPETLDATFPDTLGGANVSTRHYLMHLQAHLNYHLGQIDYLRRFVTGDGAIALSPR